MSAWLENESSGRVVAVKELLRLEAAFRLDVVDPPQHEWRRPCLLVFDKLGIFGVAIW